MGWLLIVVDITTMPLWWPFGGWRRGVLRSLLGEAVAMDQVALVRWFLSLGADPNERDNSQAVRVAVSEEGEILSVDPPVVTGTTPLMHAKNAEIARLLLARGAEVDARNPQRRTPLMYAARWSDPEVVALLLEQGADVRAVDAQGMDAIAWARWRPEGGKVIFMLEQARRKSRGAGAVRASGGR